MVCTAGQGDRLSPTWPPTPSPPSPSPAQGDTCEQGQRVSHQLVEGEVVVQLLSQRPPAALREEEEVLGWWRGWMGTGTAAVAVPLRGTHRAGPAEEGEEVAADGQQDQHAVEVEAFGRCSCPRQGGLRRGGGGG